MVDQEAITGRVKHIFNRVRGALERQETGTAAGDQAAVLGGADQGGEENVAGREGAGTQEPRGPTWSPPQSTYTFSLIRNPSDEPEMIDIKAANRFTAREKFNKQVGDYHRRRNRQDNPTRV